ncbi:MAG: hypothetical protein COB85_08215 [Bacteroidetes bacterium]|nr:MAG: hypothetical protein COB85_08215 [Bacteroidota bacterium]
MIVFISYSTDQSVLAGKIKRELDAFGFDCFLAHEDIQPTQIWTDELAQNLKKCDIFLPLLTVNFDKSIWTNQEIGYALAEGKLILPIKVNIDPSGFLTKYQALKFDTSKTFPLRKFLEALAANDEYGSDFRDFLIDVFGRSDSYDNAEFNAGYLVRIGGFTKKQMKRIIVRSMSNSQIYHGYKARDKVLNLVAQSDYKFEKELMRKFRSKMTG